MLLSMEEKNTLAVRLQKVIGEKQVVVKDLADEKIISAALRDDLSDRG